MQIRHATRNLAFVRRMALNLFMPGTTKRIGIKVKRKSCGWDGAYLIQVLSQ